MSVMSANLNTIGKTDFFLEEFASYTLICTFWIVPWLIAYFFGWVTVVLTIICSILGAVAFTYLGYAYCQCLWLGLYFCFAKHEMPVLDSTAENE